MIEAVFLDVGGVFHLPAEERMREALHSAGYDLPPNVLARAHYAGMAGHDRQGGERAQALPSTVDGGDVPPQTEGERAQALPSTVDGGDVPPQTEGEHAQALPSTVDGGDVPPQTEGERAQALPTTVDRGDVPPQTEGERAQALPTTVDRGDVPPQTEGEYVEVMEPYVAEFVRHLGVPPEQVAAAEAALLEALSTPGAWAGHLRESIEQLPALAATGARIAIVSNADGTVEARLRAEGICQVGPGPGVPVDAVIDSSAVGLRKPDPRIWERALAATGARPESSIHVGDSLLTDVGGARAAGIRPIHFDPFRLCPLTDHEHADSMAAVVDLVLESQR